MRTSISAIHGPIQEALKMKTTQSYLLLLFLVATARFRVYCQETDNDPTAEQPLTEQTPTELEHMAYFPSTCGIFRHTLVLEEDGCRGELPVLSCVGMCESGEDPLITFGSRDSVPNYPFKSRCTCCQVTTGQLWMRQVPIDWECADNTTRRTIRLAATATKCDCAPCGVN